MRKSKINSITKLVIYELNAKSYILVRLNVLDYFYLNTKFKRINCVKYVINFLYIEVLTMSSCSIIMDISHKLNFIWFCLAQRAEYY